MTQPPALGNPSTPTVLQRVLPAFAPVARQSGSGANLSSRTGVDSHTLSDVSRLLSELRSAMKKAARADHDLDEVRDRLDVITASIAGAAGSRPARSPGIVGREVPLIEARFINANVTGWGLRHADVPRGGHLDIQAEVTASAQVAGMLLSFGDSRLNLGSASDSFVIEVGGRDGSRVLSFASGTTLDYVAEAITSLAESTGVRAVASGTTGVRLESLSYGSEAFVSVRVEDDGLIGNRENIGVYGFDASDSGAADPSSGVEYAAVSNPLIDLGQDVAGTVNGHAAAGRGLSLFVESPEFGGRIDLSPYGAGTNAQTLGRLTAFTLFRAVREGPGGPGGPSRGIKVDDRPSDARTVGALSARADSARVVELLSAAIERRGGGRRSVTGDGENRLRG